MFSFALTRCEIADNRSASIPSSEVTHADDGDSGGESQPPMTIVSNKGARVVLRMGMVCLTERVDGSAIPTQFIH